MAKLGYKLFIERDGKIEPFNGFTEGEKVAIQDRLSRSMSLYFSRHPEELH